MPFVALAIAAVVAALSSLRRLLVLAVAAVVGLAAVAAHAQVFIDNVRVGSVAYHHATVGTSAADAITSTSVLASLLGWQICADGANTSYIAVSTHADPDTNGVRVAAGECLACPNCTPATLKDANVKSGAAAQGYSVLQYKQQ